MSQVENPILNKALGGAEAVKYSYVHAVIFCCLISAFSSDINLLNGLGRLEKHSGGLKT